jgi:Fe-S cluster biosynthesis and repair protein YggX
MPPIWRWTDEDRAILKELYPHATKDVILSKITHKTWVAITKEASRLGIKRNSDFDAKRRYGNTGKPEETKMDREQLLDIKAGFRSKPWSEDEHEALKIFYPRSAMEIVLDTLSKRSWMEIKIEAELLGIKRRVNDFEPKRKKKISHTLSKKKLEKLLVKEDITVEEIAEKLNTTPDIVRRNMSRYGL